MNTEQLRWQIPLGRRPEILLVAIGNHEPGVRRYLFPLHWCLHFFRYEAELLLDNKRLPIKPGSVGVVPPGVLQEYRCKVQSIHAVALFQLPKSEEALNDNSNLLTVRAMQDKSVIPPDKFEALYQGMQEAIEVFPMQPRRAEVRLWDILWQIVDETHQPHGSEFRLHPQVLQAMQIIELRLNKPIRVAQLAKEVGLSHDRLTKLFHAFLNTTVVGYIRERRVARVHILLVSSTIPIKNIPAETGFPNLHAMNKTVRLLTGYSPRYIRKHSLSLVLPSKL